VTAAGIKSIWKFYAAAVAAAGRPRYNDRVIEFTPRDVLRYRAAGTLLVLLSLMATLSLTDLDPFRFAAELAISAGKALRPPHSPGRIIPPTG